VLYYNQGKGKQPNQRRKTMKKDFYLVLMKNNETNKKELATFDRIAYNNFRVANDCTGDYTIIKVEKNS